jgi:hypothetical protein
MTKRILLVSAYGLFPMLEFELAIMSEFSNTDEIYFSRCIGMQSKCSANTHKTRILKQLKCLKCKSRVDAGLIAFSAVKKINIIDRTFENFSDYTLPLEAREILEFSAYSNAMTHLDSSGKPTDETLHDYFEIAFNSLASYVELINKHNINTVYIYNGRLAEYAPLVWYCKYKNIDFNTYEYPMHGNNKYTFCERGNVSDITFLSDQFKSTIKHKTYEINEGCEFFHKRINRLHNDLSTQFLMNQEKGNISSLDKNINQKNIISIFTSNEIEYSGVHEISIKRFYKTQSELIDQIINKSPKDYTLIIRVHPNAKYDKFHSQSIKDICSKHNDVILFNHDSKVDSYELINKSSLVITFGSTIGIESMFLKKPSICIGPSIYSKFVNNYNIIYTNEKFTDFLENIESHILYLSTKELISQNYISACQYGYAWKNSGINSYRISSKAYGKIFFRADAKSISFNSSLVSRILYKFFKGVIND